MIGFRNISTLSGSVWLLYLSPYFIVRSLNNFRTEIYIREMKTEIGI